MRRSVQRLWLAMIPVLVCLVAFAGSALVRADDQAPGSAGTVSGMVTDPQAAAIPNAHVTIENPVTAYRRTATTDAEGKFSFANVPPNNYHVVVTALGFEPTHQDIAIRSSVPITLKFPLALAVANTTVNVQSEAGDLVESVPTAHTDVDQQLIARLPMNASGSGLSDVITNATPGVAADSNGLFHPAGDHADSMVSLDNQPITDQQSRTFSNQLTLNTIGSMEVISGIPPAEYGDKASLVINAVSRTGLGQTKPTGELDLQYGSYGTWGENFSYGMGGTRWGNFLALNSAGSGRFLDTPETAILHDRGNTETGFDRVDFQPNSNNTLHIDMSMARTGFQVPNTYDQQFAGQQQHQTLNSVNFAPGWVHVLSPSSLWSVTTFYRHDDVHYLPSGNLFSDRPATVGESRHLTNLGGKFDFSYVKGRNNAKVGGQVQHTLLSENFSLGLTDPGFNPVCLQGSGQPVTDPTVTNPNQCAAGGFQANPNLQPGLVPYDLTRGGTLFGFRGHADIKEETAYAEDTMTL
ncbi:MAG: TonB-dependent receptor, partial [Terriglobales bacterium]